MYIECVRSKGQKNSLGEEAKGWSGASWEHPNGLQIGFPKPSESAGGLEHASSLQKHHFFLTGTTMEEAKGIPKSSPGASRTT